MGRKPNQLIFHYFHRGQKLEDASNRYQHTCKACGEVFPKGRIDSLQNHLMRKCPALTAQEQAHIVSQVYHVSPSAQAKKVAKGKEKQSHVVNHNQPPHQTFDGLNVLAEASRQVTQVERRGSQSYASTAAAQDDSDPMNMAIDPALDVFPHSFPNTFDHELGTFAQANASHASDIGANTIPPLPHLPNEHAEDEANAHTIHPHDGVDPQNNGQQDHDLSTIAAGASELLPAQAPRPNHTDRETVEVSEVSREPGDAVTEDIAQNDVHGLGGQNGDISVASYEESGQNDNHGIRHSAHSVEQSNGSQIGITHETDKPNETWVNYDDGPHFQAFWEAMRGTNPKSPRAVVTQPPQRRIAVRAQVGAGEFGEFSLDTQPAPKFTRQKFSAERRKEVQDVRKKGACLRCRMLRKPCSSDTPCGTCRNIESARLWKEPCMRVRITELFGLYGVGLHAALAHRQVQVIRSQPQQQDSQGYIQFTHSDNPSLSVSIKAADIHVDTSNIPGLTATSEGGSNIRSVKLVESDGEDMIAMIASYLDSQGPILRENESSRVIKSSLATLEDILQEHNEPLLEDILQLWAATHVLCDPELGWNISYTPSTKQKCTIIDENSDQLSYRLLACQLQSFVERRASQLCKKVLQSYEKKLMHNMRTFDMFLIAIVIINCIERMEWLFHIWADAKFSVEWPLPQKPNEYFSQGENFSEILHMVLKMRLVPPKVAPRPDTGVLMPVDVTTDQVVNWYSSAHLTLDYIHERQNRDFDPNDIRSFDLRYASKILLPQNAYS